MLCHAVQVQFVIVAYSELSLMALISQGLHALPVLQVNTNVSAGCGRGYICKCLSVFGGATEPYVAR